MKSTVASTPIVSRALAHAGEEPSTPSRMRSASPTHGRWSSPGSSTELRAGNVGREIAPALDRHGTIAGAVEHEGRNVHGGEDRAHVDGRRSCSRAPGTAAGLAPWRRYFAQVARNRSSSARLGARVSRPTGPPQSRATRSRKAVSVLLRHRPWVVGSGHLARDSHRAGSARWVRAGCVAANRTHMGATLGDAEQRRALGSDGIAHRQEVAHARLEGGQRRRAPCPRGRCRACRRG